VPLSELLFRSLVHFLQTGRYVDCRLVAQSYSYAEDRALNALQQQATAEDLAFDYGRCRRCGLFMLASRYQLLLLCNVGFVLTKEGYVHKSSSHATSGIGKAPIAAVVPQKLSLFGLFRPKQHAAQAGVPPTAPKRRTSFMRTLSNVTGAGTADPHSFLAPEHQALARQLERELGCGDPVSSRLRHNQPGAAASTSATDLDEASRIAAVAARNAVKKRVPTDWKAFLDHKYDVTAAAKSGQYLNINNSNKGGKAGPPGLQRENSSSTSNSNPSTARKSIFERRREEAQRLGNENGSYTYGLGRGGDSGAREEVSPGISVADVKASKASAKAGQQAAVKQHSSALEETIAVKRISCFNLISVVRTNATSLCEEDVEVPQFPHELAAPGPAPAFGVVVAVGGVATAGTQTTAQSRSDAPSQSTPGGTLAGASSVVTSPTPRDNSQPVTPLPVKTLPTRVRSEAKSSESGSSQASDKQDIGLDRSDVTNRPNCADHTTTAGTDSNNSSQRFTAEEAEVEERARLDSADRTRFDSSGSLSSAVQALLAISRDSDSDDERQLQRAGCGGVVCGGIAAAAAATPAPLVVLTEGELSASSMSSLSGSPRVRSSDAQPTAVGVPLPSPPLAEVLLQGPLEKRPAPTLTVRRPPAPPSSGGSDQRTRHPALQSALKGADDASTVNSTAAGGDKQASSASHVSLRLTGLSSPPRSPTAQTVVYARRRSPLPGGRLLAPPPPSSPSSVSEQSASAAVKSHAERGHALCSDESDTPTVVPPLVTPQVEGAGAAAAAVPPVAAVERGVLIPTAAAVSSNVGQAVDINTDNAYAGAASETASTVSTTSTAPTVPSHATESVARDPAPVAIPPLSLVLPSRVSPRAAERAAAKAAEAAAKVAEEEAARAKLAALKAERHLREMKRMRTAVFKPTVVPATALRGGRTDAALPAAEAVPAPTVPAVQSKQLETFVYGGRAVPVAEQALLPDREVEGQEMVEGGSVKARTMVIEQKVQRLERSKQLLQKYSMLNVKAQPPAS
jgi:hypothetical protein